MTIAVNPTGLSLLRSNLLINGQFRISQRGTTFDSTTTPANDDDTYLLDRWVLLSDGNDVVDVSQESSITPVGSFNSIKLDIETANKKAGILQILEARDAKRIIGGKASLSFKAEKVVGNTTVDKLRAAIISWDSTADSVTSDVVSAWNAEGADPTLVANWTYENTPSDLTLTDSFQTFTIENVDIDTASTANVALFIWIDNDDGTVGDLVYISDVKLEEGSVATPYPVENEADVLAKCQRYAIIYDNGLTGVDNARFLPVGQCIDTNTVILQMNYPNTMRSDPTVTFSATGACGLAITDGSFAVTDAVSATSPKPLTVQLTLDRTGSGLVAGDCSAVRIESSNYILFDAEL